MASVNLIAAVGKSGQIGLNGELPWANTTNEVIKTRAKADMALFKQLTTNGIIVVGHNTHEELYKKYNEDYWNKSNRLLIKFSRDWYDDPAKFIDLMVSTGRTVWIAGGTMTYLRLFPFVNGAISISVMPEYDGPADRYLPEEIMRFANVHG